jgi:GT2 family glycosyltransferase
MAVFKWEHWIQCAHERPKLSTVALDREHPRATFCWRDTAAEFNIASPLRAKMPTGFGWQRAAEMELRAAIIISVQAETSPHTTKLCLEAVGAQAHATFAQIVVVGNGVDPTALARFVGSGAHIAVSPTFGARNASQARNEGASLTSAQVLVFLDSAYVPAAGWLHTLLAAFDRMPAVDIVGGLTLTPLGNIHNAGLSLTYGLGPPLGVALSMADHAVTETLGSRICRAVPAEAFAIRQQTFRNFNGFDTAFKRKGDDIDLCLRYKRTGKHCWFEHQAQLQTDARARYDLERNVDDQALLHQRWLPQQDAFDEDIRHRLKGSAPKAVSSLRPAMTVISVILPGVLATLGPWLEITRATLGPADQWLIVNASHDIASATYGQWMADHCPNALFIEAPGGSYQAAVAKALAAASEDHVALPSPNEAPSWHWLERGAVHLQNPTSQGVARIIAASLPVLGTSAPADKTLDLNVMQRSLMTSLAGAGVESFVADTFCFLGNKTALTELCSRDSWPQLGTVYSAFDIWSTQLGTEARPALLLGAIKTVQQHASANLAFEEVYRREAGRVASVEVAARYGCQPFTGLVSIVVPVLNQPELTKSFLDSVYSNTHRPFEIVLVDNGSGPKIRDLVESYAAAHGNLVYIRNEQNQGFGYACNQGLHRARGKAVVVINNDVLVPQGWLARMLAVLQAAPRVGMVGPVTNRCVGSQQIFPAPYAATKDFVPAAAARAISHRANTKNVGRLVGLCLLLPRHVLNQVGGFDPCFGYGNFEDDDLGLRIRRAGFELAVAEDVLIHHEGSATFTGAGFDARALAQQNWEIFCLKWQHDPNQANFDLVESLAGQAPFSHENDFVPLSFSEQFATLGNALALQADKPIKLLFTPNIADNGWWEPLRAFLETFGPADPVAIVLRPEPPTRLYIEQSLAEASSLINEVAKAKALPAVLLETTNLAPLARGSLYRAVQAWIETPGPLAPFISREATAVGLPTIAATPNAMKAMVEACKARLA